MRNPLRKRWVVRHYDCDDELITAVPERQFILEMNAVRFAQEFRSVLYTTRIERLS